MADPSTEIVTPAELVNPMTGEIVLAADIAKVASVVRELKEMQDKVAAARRAFGSILVEHSKVVGARTFIVEGIKVEVSAADELTWDIEALNELRTLGLPEERFDQLVVAHVEMKVNGTVARQLSGASPEYKRVIEGAKRRHAKSQSASIK